MSFNGRYFDTLLMTNVQNVQFFLLLIFFSLINSTFLFLFILRTCFIYQDEFVFFFNSYGASLGKFQPDVLNPVICEATFPTLFQGFASFTFVVRMICYFRHSCFICSFLHFCFIFVKLPSPSYINLLFLL